MARQGDFGGNTAGPSSSLGHYFTPSFPTPATIGAQASQVPFQANGSEPFITGAGMPWSGHPSANALAQPAIAPQNFQPESHPCWTMPQARAPNARPFLHFGGASVQQLPGEELAARVAAININIMASQTFQPNNYTHGWLQPLPPPQAPPAPCYPAPRPVGPGDSATWGQPFPPPQDAHFHQWPVVDMAPASKTAVPQPPIGANNYGTTSWAPPMSNPDWPTSWAPPVQSSDGQTSWAPPVQPSDGQTSWAPPVQHPGGQTSWVPSEQQPVGHGQTSWAPPMQQPGGETMSWAPSEQQPGEQTNWMLSVQQPGGQTSWVFSEQQPGEQTSWAPSEPQHVGQTSLVPPTLQPGEQTSWAPSEQHPIGQTSWAPPMQQPGEQTSWAPSVQQPGGQTTISWAPPEQRQGVPPAPPASGAAQAQAQAPVPGDSKTFEEFLMDAGILDDMTVDDMLVDDFIKDLMGEGAAELGPVEPDGPMASLGGTGLPPPSATGSSSWPSRDEVGIFMARAPKEEEQVGPAVGGCGRDPEAAAVARERRGRRIAMRKEKGAIARARPRN